MLSFCQEKYLSAYKKSNDHRTNDKMLSSDSLDLFKKHQQKPVTLQVDGTIEILNLDITYAEDITEI